CLRAITTLIHLFDWHHPCVATKRAPNLLDLSSYRLMAQKLFAACSTTSRWRHSPSYPRWLLDLAPYGLNSLALGLKAQRRVAEGYPQAWSMLNGLPASTRVIPS